MSRQQTRKLLLLISMFLFPVTLYYLSPVLLITAGLKGIINGGFIVFSAMLTVSVFFGRLFCAYLCPGGGLQECARMIRDKEPKQRRRNSIKYVIWLIWISAVIVCYAIGGVNGVDFFYETDHGISVTSINAYIVYYGIVLLIILPALIEGKRAFCHYFCWMAPFMVVGTKIRKLLRLPGLHIAADSGRCTSCNKCNRMCPMSVDVQSAAKQGRVLSSECINCGSCVDACPKKALHYKWYR